MSDDDDDDGGGLGAGGGSQSEWVGWKRGWFKGWREEGVYSLTPSCPCNIQIGPNVRPGLGSAHLEC